MAESFSTRALKNIFAQAHPYAPKHHQFRSKLIAETVSNNLMPVFSGFDDFHKSFQDDPSHFDDLKDFNSEESSSEEQQAYLSRPENECRVISKIWHLRAFINYTKSCLMVRGIDTGLKGPKLGIDMGCYKGGDLKKWLHCNVDHLILIEPNREAWQECFNRYLFLRSNRSWFFEANFLQRDFTKETILPDELVDLVSSQMSVHKAFASKEQAHQMAFNVSCSLKKGGRFIASFTSSKEVLKRLEDSPYDRFFGNELYCISFDEALPKPVPAFGVQFSFRLENIEYYEYLVSADVLTEIFSQYGLKLVQHMTLKDWYNMAIQDNRQIKVMERLDVVKMVQDDNGNKVPHINLSSNELEVADLFDSILLEKL